MNKFRTAILGASGGSPATPLVQEKNAAKGRGEGLASIVSRDAERKTDHRDTDRHRLARETVSIGYKNKSCSADLINLSGGGAMIEADIKPRLWDRIDLYLGEGQPIECAVRWLRNGRIGLEFAHETQIACDADQRDSLLLDVIRRSFPEVAATTPVSDPEPDAPSETIDASRRGEARHPLIWNGVILWQHEQYSVRLRNISASGVLIDGPVDFPHNAELMLDLGESGQYFAKVGWSRSGQTGLVFKHPFDLSLLAAGKPEVAPQSWVKPSYLDASSTEASPWATEWERRNLSDLRADLEGFLKY